MSLGGAGRRPKLAPQGRLHGDHTPHRRRALRDSTLGRYDRTYRRPQRRQACYGEFIMPSFYHRGRDRVS
jgi:hypothetical protein